MHTSERKPDGNAYPTERLEAEHKWQALFEDKLKVVHHAMSVSGSKIKPHKILVLMDLQGVYLGLHNWLSENGVPIDGGVVLASFAHSQIERCGREIAARVVAAQPTLSCNLNDLFGSIEIEYLNGKAYLGKQLDIAKDATYINFSVNFEIFYAPVPFDSMAWQLKKSAKRGSSAARDQLKAIESGNVTRKGVFERNYKPYEDFVSHLKTSLLYAGSQEGFFSFYVGDRGLSYFDEKEVDTRIVIRAMDALYKGEADSLCIVSSDQDFLPLHSRADDFGIASYQIDLSKFTEQDRVGARIKNLQKRFIRCGVDPNWPLEVLTKAISKPDIGHFATYNLSEDELHALCKLHNALNDVQIELQVQPDGKATMVLRKPK